MSAKKDVIPDRIQAAVDAPVPHIYANGFASSLSTADVIIAFELNSAPAATLNLSYTAAKTLVVKIGAAIAALETATGRPMLVTDEVERYMKEDK